MNVVRFAQAIDWAVLAVIRLIYGDSWTSHIYEPKSKWSTQLRLYDITMFLPKNVFQNTRTAFQWLGCKRNVSKLHLGGPRIVSCPWFCYRYVDFLFLPRVPSSELPDALWDSGYLSILNITFYTILTGGWVGIWKEWRHDLFWSYLPKHCNGDAEKNPWAWHRYSK